MRHGKLSSSHAAGLLEGLSAICRVNTSEKNDLTRRYVVAVDDVQPLSRLRSVQSNNQATSSSAGSRQARRSELHTTSEQQILFESPELDTFPYRASLVSSTSGLRSCMLRLGRANCALGRCAWRAGGTRSLLSRQIPTQNRALPVGPPSAASAHTMGQRPQPLLVLQRTQQNKQCRRQAEALSR